MWEKEKRQEAAHGSAFPFVEVDVGAARLEMQTQIS